MVESQAFQPAADRVINNQSETPAPLMVNWGPEERAWSQNLNCRQVGNQIICDDIYGSARPSVVRASFALPENDPVRSLVALQMSMGLIGPSQSGSDRQVPSYYQPAALANPAIDQYAYNQGLRVSQLGTAATPDINVVNPYSFHQGDKTTVYPVNPGIIPPYIKPNGHEVPQPPLPGPVIRPSPIEVPPPPKPVPPPPRPDMNNCPPDDNQYNPCNPCNPCRPFRDGGWYPGMIAGRVIGRIFGGRGRCR